MSQISVLTEAIEKLEIAETAVDNARDAFDPDSRDYGVIADQFEVIGDAVQIIKKILSRVEQQKLLQHIEENKHASIS